VRLYLIRHGESENNVKGCWTGWQDVNLTDKGIDDAKSVKKHFEDVQFDRIYSSDLNRAIKTAEMAVPGCIYIKTELLREINVGSLSGEKFEIGISKFGEDLTKNINNGDYTAYGGESTEQLDVRIKKFIKMLERDNLKTVAAFTHVGMMRRFIKNVINLEFSAEKVICKNCAIAILDYTDRKWNLHSWINFI